MLRDRRYFLRMVALSPLTIRGPQAFAARLFGSTAGPCNCINILLHGFFFMEFQKDDQGKDMLVVASPQVDGHQPLYRDHDSWLLQPPDPVIDLRGALSPGSRQSFPDRVLCFSRKDISLPRDYFVSLANNYSLLMKLPLPRDIVPLRLGLRADLPLSGGNVARSIEHASNSEHVALVVRLKYDDISDPFFPSTRSYYEEHCYFPDIGDVKAALDAARTVFGKEFDLDIPDLKDAIVDLDNQSDLPDEISPDDEIALSEGAPCLPSGAKDVKKHQSRRGNHRSKNHDSKEGDDRTVEPSTCPLFGVNP